jgi:hypothetical protein
MTDKKDNKTVRVPPPALNPENCAIVQPWKDFVSRGFISSLDIKFTPMGVNVSCSVQQSLMRAEDPSDGKIAIGEAKNRIIEAKLWVPREKGNSKMVTSKEDNLPKKSLVKADFDGKSDQELIQRANAVAKATGDTTARGRIGSLKMYIEGVDNFEKWWESSSPKEKSRLLTDKKNHDSLTDDQHIRLSGVLVKCPFRGSVPVQSQEDDSEEEEEEEVTQGGKELVPAKASPSQSPKGKGK